MSASDLAHLLAMRREYGAGLTTEFVDFPVNEWVQRDGQIVHRRTDFFRLVGQRDADGVERILFHQPDTALVGLLTAVEGAERYVLLNARVEPGLHGGCQFSTTIQSTPSNYERRHGGAATPLIELFLAPAPHARVVHDSMQYDWGQYYDAKVKRFLVLEISERLPVQEPLVWVSSADFEALLLVDYGVTGDLRVAALALQRRVPAPTDPVAAVASPDRATVQVPLGELQNWRMHARGIDEVNRIQGLAIRYARTQARTREVAEWSQPLMVVDAGLDVCLPVRETAAGVEGAVQRRSAAGLRDTELWYPATPADPDSRTRRTTLLARASAEGGRFWRHEVRLSTTADGDDDVAYGSRWVGLTELLNWAMADRCTSIELRLVLASLLVSQRSDAR